MEPKRQRELTLAGVVVLLGIVTYAAYVTWVPGARPSTAQAAASNDPQSSRRASRAGQAGSAAPQVHLDALGEDRPAPDPAGRDLFRFKVKPPPPAAGRRQGRSWGRSHRRRHHRRRPCRRSR